MRNTEDENIRYGLEAVGNGLQALGIAICLGLIVAALIVKTL
jgi:hypothetical protein